MLKVDVPRREDSASFSSGASISPAVSLPRLKDWDASMSVAVLAAGRVPVRGAGCPGVIPTRVGGKSESPRCSYPGAWSPLSAPSSIYVSEVG